MHLFAYGTLMFAEVWRRIEMRELPSQPASLRGYAVFRLQGAVIPGMVHAGEDDQVVGVIYRDLDEATLEELDAYESDLYERVAVEATDVDGTQIECQAYVIPESQRHMLSDEPWDPVRFEKKELAKYLSG